MKEKFDLLLSEYLKDASKLVNSSKEYYLEFVKNAPKDIYKYFDKEKYLIKASIGAGQKSEIPWLCIFNRSVTTSATQGIYICYLFKSDMSGFYLVLGQGITTFADLYGIEKYKNIEKVAKYFRNLIDDNEFSRENIDLKGKKELAKGYEAGTIISKYYEKGNYSDEQLIDDLIALKSIYEDICENMSNTSYMNIVDNVLNNIELSYVMAEDARKILKETLKEEKDIKITDTTMLEQVDIPKFKKKNKYARITKKVTKKNRLYKEGKG